MLIYKTNLKGKVNKEIEKIFESYKDEFDKEKAEGKTVTVLAVLAKENGETNVVCDIKYMTKETAIEMTDKIKRKMLTMNIKSEEINENITEIKDLMEDFTEEKAFHRDARDKKELIQFVDEEELMNEEVVKKLKNEISLWVIKNGELLNKAKLDEEKNVITFGYLHKPGCVALGYNVNRKVFNNEQDATDFAEWAAKKVSDCSDELFGDKFSGGSGFIKKEDRREKDKEFFEEEDEEEVDEELVEMVKDMGKNHPEIIKEICAKLAGKSIKEPKNEKDKMLKKVVDSFVLGIEGSKKFRNSAEKALKEILEEMKK